MSVMLRAIWRIASATVSSMRLPALTFPHRWCSGRRGSGSVAGALHGLPDILRARKKLYCGAAVVVTLVVSAACGSAGGSGNQALSSAYSVAACATSGEAWAVDRADVYRALNRGRLVAAEQASEGFVRDLRGDGCLAAAGRRARLEGLASDLEVDGRCPVCVDVVDRAGGGGG